ncbi:MAG: (d)CMP kinase [Bacteroidota bacterium]
MTKRINIAIDGFSSCGKSTLAKDLAQSLSYKYIDSGAMYRAITLYAWENDLIIEELDAQKLIESLQRIQIDFLVDMDKGTDEILLNNRRVEDEIRKPRISKWVSHVAALPEIRKKLVSIQQGIGKEKGVVMDGRDIGTVVFPEAELKIFVQADLSIRAERRWNELNEKGIDISLSEVKKSLAKRDEIDSNRKTSPLIQAEDAKVLNTTYLSRQEQLDKAFGWYKELIGN